MADKTDKIKCIWRVECDGNEYDSEEEAILAAKIMEADNIYIETYQRKRVIQYICANFTLIPKQKTVESSSEDGREQR